MATNKIPTMLRLPESIHGKIKKLAELECRSMNTEIEFALASYISQYESVHGVISLSPEKE